MPTASTRAGSGGCLFASRTSAALRFGVTSPDTHPALLVLGGLQRHVCLLEVAAKEIKIKNKIPDSLGGSLVGEELILRL